jgi:hypothetical protein
VVIALIHDITTAHARDALTDVEHAALCSCLLPKLRQIATNENDFAEIKVFMLWELSY